MGGGIRDAHHVFPGSLPSNPTVRMMFQSFVKQHCCNVIIAEYRRS